MSYSILQGSTPNTPIRMGMGFYTFKCVMKTAKKNFLDPQLISISLAKILMINRRYRIHNHLQNLILNFEKFVFYFFFDRIMVRT